MALRIAGGKAPSVSTSGGNNLSGNITIGGNLTIDGSLNLLDSNSIFIGDNLAEALTIYEGINPYLRFVTTNGSEIINVYKSILSLSSGSGANSALAAFSALPTITMVSTGSGANAKNWDVQATGNNLNFRTRTDLDGAGNTYITVTRSGISIASITITSPVVNISGRLNLNGASDNSSYALNILQSNISVTRVTGVGGQVSSYGVGSPGAANYECFNFAHNGTSAFINQTISGSGVYRSLFIFGGGSAAITIDTSQNVSLSSRLAVTGNIHVGGAIYSSSYGVNVKGTNIAASQVSGSGGALDLFGIGDPSVVNYESLHFSHDGSSGAYIRSLALGSGSYRPIIFETGGSTALTINIDNSVQMGAGLYLLDGGSSLTHFEEGSFTMTLLNVTVPDTGTAYYTRIGKIVTLLIPPLFGTSNDNYLAIDSTGWPASILPGADVGVGPFYLSDAGLNVSAAVGTGYVYGTGGIRFFKNDNSTGFTNSGTKGISGPSGQNQYYAITYRIVS